MLSIVIIVYILQTNMILIAALIKKLNICTSVLSR